MSHAWRIWNTDETGALSSPLRKYFAPPGKLHDTTRFIDRITTPTVYAHCEHGGVSEQCECGIRYMDDAIVLLGGFVAINSDVVLTTGTVGDIVLAGGGPQIYDGHDYRTDRYTITGMIAPERFQTVLMSTFAVPVLSGMTGIPNVIGIQASSVPQLATIVDQLAALQ